MISFLGKSITLFLLRNNIIEKEKTPVYEYGFEVMISTMIGFCLIFTAVFLLNELALAMIFYYHQAIYRRISCRFPPEMQVDNANLLTNKITMIYYRE